MASYARVAGSNVDTYSKKYPVWGFSFPSSRLLADKHLGIFVSAKQASLNSMLLMLIFKREGQPRARLLNGGRHNVCVLIILEGCLTAMEVLSVVEWLMQNFDKWKVAGSIPVRHANLFKRVELLAVASPCSKGKSQSSFISEIWSGSLRVTTNIPLGTNLEHFIYLLLFHI